MADKSLLLGDEAADLLLSYAALIAQIRRGDHLSMQAIGVDGAEVEAGILLNSGTVLLIETSASRLPEPDNADAIAYIRSRLQYYGYDGAQGHPHPGTEIPDAIEEA